MVKLELPISENRLRAIISKSEVKRT